MKRFLLILLVIVVGVKGTFGQEGGVLEGALFSKPDNAGFSGRAQISIVGIKRGDISDEKGHFIIQNIPEGVYQVQIACIGYKDTIVNEVRIIENGTTTLNLNFPIGCHVLNHHGKVCPNCQKVDQVIPIVYGLPDSRLMQKVKKNKVRLAGCMRTGCDPTWYCKRDKIEF